MSIVRGVAACALALLPLTPACTCSQPTPAPSGAAPSASAAPASSPSGAASAEIPSQDPDIKPVYPPLTGPPHPLAKKLCDALHGLPARRRAECCSKPPSPGVESECLRNLTGALASGAVAADEAAIDRCAQAVAADLQGCDWVAPFPFTPSTPAACQGLLKGSRPAGAACRSALECEGELHCAGVGPTSVGRCAPPREAGPCGPSVDALVGYTRQTDADKAHPQCKGICDRNRCSAPLKEGDACVYNEACGPGHHCGDGRCKKGDAGKEKEPCLGTRCAPGTRCDRGTCVAPKKENEACDRDEQCRGFCVKKAGDGPDAAKGTCAPRCEAFLPINAAASARLLPRLPLRPPAPAR